MRVFRVFIVHSVC